MSQVARTNRRPRLALWLGIGALAIGSATFAGAQIYRSYHVKIQTPTGVAEVELTADAKGNAHGTVPVEGGKADINVTDKGGGQKQVQVTMDGATSGTTTVTTNAK